jgi:hypothetical protein
MMALDCAAKGANLLARLSHSGAKQTKVPQTGCSPSFLQEKNPFLNQNENRSFEKYPTAHRSGTGVFSDAYETGC